MEKFDYRERADVNNKYLKQSASNRMLSISSRIQENHSQAGESKKSHAGKASSTCPFTKEKYLKLVLERLDKGLSICPLRTRA